MGKVLVIHSRVSLIPRRVIVPEHDAQIENISRHLLVGEAGFHLDHEILHTASIHEHVATRYHVHASTIPSSRCVIVNADGLVVAAVMADPDIDSHPDGRIIQSDTLSVGDRI